MLFTGAKGTRLAWHVTYQATSVALYDAVVDATSGAVLYRQNLVKFAGDATVWPNFPGGELQAAAARHRQRGEVGRPRDGRHRPAGVDLGRRHAARRPVLAHLLGRE